MDAHSTAATSMVSEELQHADQAHQRAVHELTQSNAELERFAFIGSYDLRQPIRTMGADAFILRTNYGEQLHSQG